MRWKFVVPAALLAILIVAQPTGGTAGRASKRAIAVIIGVAASLLIVQVVHTQAVFTILTAVAVALAAYQSSRTGRRVVLPQKPA